MNLYDIHEVTHAILPVPSPVSVDVPTSAEVARYVWSKLIKIYVIYVMAVHH